MWKPTLKVAESGPNQTHNAAIEAVKAMHRDEHRPNQCTKHLLIQTVHNGIHPMYLHKAHRLPQAIDRWPWMRWVSEIVDWSMLNKHNIGSSITKINLLNFSALPTILIVPQKPVCQYQSPSVPVSLEDHLFQQAYHWAASVYTVEKLWGLCLRLDWSTRYHTPTMNVLD